MILTLLKHFAMYEKLIKMGIKYIDLHFIKLILCECMKIGHITDILYLFTYSRAKDCLKSAENTF